MPMNKDREYRSSPLLSMAQEGEERSYIVEGYATTFEQPYVLVHFDGIDYMEVIDRHAFDETDMSDVIMQYDHEGKVIARQKNGSLTINTDDHGLHIRADLSGSTAAKEMYEEIRAGLVSEMSFAFSVEEESYNEENHTRRILKIRKLYDVSAVSIPANPATAISVSTRSRLDGWIEAAKAEERRELEVRRLKLKIKIGGITE